MHFYNSRCIQGLKDRIKTIFSMKVSLEKSHSYSKVWNWSSITLKRPRVETQRRACFPSRSLCALILFIDRVSLQAAKTWILQYTHGTHTHACVCLSRHTHTSASAQWWRRGIDPGFPSGELHAHSRTHFILRRIRGLLRKRECERMNELMIYREMWVCRENSSSSSITLINRLLSSGRSNFSSSIARLLSAAFPLTFLWVNRNLVKRRRLQTGVWLEMSLFICLIVDFCLFFGAIAGNMFSSFNPC